MKYIDIHNHLIFGIDDGASNRDETLKMLKVAEKDKIEKIILTPHYKEGVWENDQTIILEKYNQIKAMIKDNNLNIDVYPGCELLLKSNSYEVLDHVQTMNDTKYLLVETFLNSTYITYNIDDELYNLSVDGYKVILAHPERYQFVKEDINRVYDFVKEGHLIQLNVSSLYDKKRTHYKVAKQLLDNNLVHFIATDAHNDERRPPVLSYGYEIIKKEYGQSRADDLFYNHPLKVINNEVITSKDYLKIKKRKWFQLR